MHGIIYSHKECKKTVYKVHINLRGNYYSGGVSILNSDAINVEWQSRHIAWDCIHALHFILQFLIKGNYLPLPQLAGLVEPNVGQCNLQLIPGNQFGEYEYTRSLKEV